jgi:AcrR family transcriptional regulator
MRSLQPPAKQRAGRPRSRDRDGSRLVPPQQARSQGTEARLLAAAEPLFSEVPVADVSVAALAKAAGVSVGAFYGRFTDKDAFVAAFFERYLDDGRRRATELFASADWPTESVAEMARAFVAYRLRHYQRHRRLLHALVVHLRSQGSPALRETAARFAAHFHREATSRFASQGDASKWRVDARGVASGLTLVEAVLKDLYLFDGGGLVSPRLTEVELLDELTALFCRRLKASPPT